MNISINRKSRIPASCSLSRIILVSLIFIVLQIIIIVYQIGIWSKAKCSGPLQCSKAAFFNKIMENNGQEIFRINEIDTSRQESFFIADIVAAKNVKRDDSGRSIEDVNVNVTAGANDSVTPDVTTRFTNDANTNRTDNIAVDVTVNVTAGANDSVTPDVATRLTSDANTNRTDNITDDVTANVNHNDSSDITADETANVTDDITDEVVTVTPAINVRSCGINSRRGNTRLNGTVNLHIWYGWCGFTTDDLRRDPTFPRQPNTRTTLSELKVQRTHFKQFSGKRMFGYIHPPKTGLYQFFISSEDSSDLWLSSDDDPINTKMIAYLGEASSIYGASSGEGEFSKLSSQRSENISLIEGKAYFFDVYQKKKWPYDHLQVAWRLPDSNETQVIGSRYLSQYIDETSSDASMDRQECLMNNVPGLNIRYTKFMKFENPDEVDDFFLKAPVLNDTKVENTLPTCPYQPKYLSRNVTKQFGSHVIIVKSLVYPNDDTWYYMDVVGLISKGNRFIPEEEAKNVVSSYLKALKVQARNRFELNRIAHMEAKYDPDGGVRYFMELDLKDRENGQNVRLSRNIYSPSRKNATKLCYPEGYVWKRTTPIYLLVTIMNYGNWIKDLVSQLSRFYKEGIDRNFYLMVTDFNSTDVNLTEVLDNSDIRTRYTIIEKSGPFWKTHGLNAAAALVKDPDSIVFTMDLHLKLPASLFDAIRKHTIQGKTVFTPKLTKLKCGFSPKYSLAGWENFGYGMFAVYKSDWDRIGGMDEQQFRYKWGGEDVEIMDRVLKAKLDVERLCLPKFYHYFHRRDQDWYEDARM